MLASWSREGVIFLVLLWPSHLTTYHILSLSLSGLNWRSLFPPLRIGSPFPQNGAPIHRVRAHSLTRVHNKYIRLLWLQCIVTKTLLLLQYTGTVWECFCGWSGPYETVVAVALYCVRLLLLLKSTVWHCCCCCSGCWCWFSSSWPSPSTPP